MSDREIWIKAVRYRGALEEVVRACESVAREMRDPLAADALRHVARDARAALDADLERNDVVDSSVKEGTK